FLKQGSLAALAGATLPWAWARREAHGYFAANERPVVGCIGTGSRWQGIVREAVPFSEVAAVCDVDSRHMDGARETVKKLQGEREVNREVEACEDYRKILDRKD